MRLISRKDITSKSLKKLPDLNTFVSLFINAIREKVEKCWKFKCMAFENYFPETIGISQPTNTTKKMQFSKTCSEQWIVMSDFFKKVQSRNVTMKKKNQKISNKQINAMVSQMNCNCNCTFSLHIFIAHCTFSLHIIHFHCTLHIPLLLRDD